MTDTPEPQPWPEPDSGLLEDGRPELPDFPLESLSPFWRGWVSDTAAAVAAPIDYVVQALLASVAAVCGAGVVARINDSWDEPLILWLALVGGPGNGKTPALAAQRRALAAVEGTMTREGRGLAVIDNATPLPALLAAAAKRPAGAVLWRDEPGTWLAALGRNGRREPIDVGPLLDAWSPLRTSQGPGRAPIGIIGCLDPARFGEALSGSEDGRAARFLYAWPKTPPYRSFLDRPALRESEGVQALQRIARIAGDPAKPQALSLDAQALKVLDGHLARLHRALQASESVEAAWLGKGRGMVARLGAARALLDWAANASAVAPTPSVLRGETLSAACLMWDYFHRHAQAVLGRGVRSEGEPRLRQVLGWIRAAKRPQISREDVRREALGQALNAAQSMRVIDALERAGHLRKLEVAAGPGGGPRPLRWEVNPALIGESLAPTALTAPTQSL
ncbi:MAG: DUF3987 domain-containing protein, partial [Alphaproteobacteria bacterium]|nr:DUF3987 domain-containing protein [Alphaproteobacteria bacterium]